MPKVPKAPSKGKKKKIVTTIVVVLLLILAAVAGVLLQWLQHQGGNGSKNPGNSQGNSDDTSAYANPLPQSVQDAQNTAAQGNYDQSNKEIATSLATTSNNDEKYELYLAEGTNYENQQKYDDAITAYQNAGSIKKTWTVYKALGHVMELKGDKAAAISYYKQAEAAMTPTMPRYTAEKYDLDQSIKVLGG